MHFIKQHRSDAGKLGIGLYPVAENPFGQNKNARCGGLFRVHSRGIADAFANGLSNKLSHAFSGGARGETAGREQQDLSACHPRLI